MFTLNNGIHICNCQAWRNIHVASGCIGYANFMLGVSYNHSLVVSKCTTLKQNTHHGLSLFEQKM